MSLLTKPAPIAGILGLALFLVPIFSFEKLTRSASAALNRTQPDADVAMLPDLTLSTTVLICLPDYWTDPPPSRGGTDVMRGSGAPGVTQRVKLERVPVQDSGRQRFKPKGVHQIYVVSADEAFVKSLRRISGLVLR
jgi:hypothetical protein